MEALLISLASTPVRVVVLFVDLLPSALAEGQRDVGSLRRSLGSGDDGEAELEEVNNGGGGGGCGFEAVILSSRTTAGSGRLGAPSSVVGVGSTVLGGALGRFMEGESGEARSSLMARCPLYSRHEETTRESSASCCPSVPGGGCSWIAYRPSFSPSESTWSSRSRGDDGGLG